MWGTMLGYSTRHATTKISKRTGALPIPASIRNAPHTRSTVMAHTHSFRTSKHVRHVVVLDGLRHVATRRGERDGVCAWPDRHTTHQASRQRNGDFCISLCASSYLGLHILTCPPPRKTQSRDFFRGTRTALHGPLQAASAHTANFTVLYDSKPTGHCIYLCLQASSSTCAFHFWN